MRTIYGNLKVDKMTSPNPTVAIDHDKNIFPIGMTLEHFGEHSPLEMVFTYGRSNRIFFREAKNPEDKPERQLIVPATTEVAKNAIFAVHPTDSKDFVILDFKESLSPLVAMTNPSLDHGCIIVWDFEYDRLLHFQSIDEYDLYVSAQSDSKVAVTPIPTWSQDNGYSFSKEDFVAVNVSTPESFGFEKLFHDINNDLP